MFLAQWQMKRVLNSNSLLLNRRLTFNWYLEKTSDDKTLMKMTLKEKAVFRIIGSILDTMKHLDLILFLHLPYNSTVNRKLFFLGTLINGSYIIKFERRKVYTTNIDI